MHQRFALDGSTIALILGLDLDKRSTSVKCQHPSVWKETRSCCAVRAEVFLGARHPTSSGVSCPVCRPDTTPSLFPDVKFRLDSVLGLATMASTLRVGQALKGMRDTYVVEK